MPEISMVIPTYTINEDLELMTEINASTYRNQVDELIIVEDGGKYSKDLEKIADVYAYNHDNVGFTANVNRGWKLSTGDFTMIASSDTQLYEGLLADLCIKGKVTSPRTTDQNIPYLWGAFFVVPKEIKEERGMLKEEMRTYSSDSEYDNRVRDIFLKVNSVRVHHEQSQTVKPAGVEGGKEQEKDMLAYKKLIDEGKAK